MTMLPPIGLILKVDKSTRQTLGTKLLFRELAERGLDRQCIWCGEWHSERSGTRLFCAACPPGYYWSLPREQRDE